ncbi:MAG: GTPase HflX [Eubacterium sp.]|nr:GTPase HflX [Eubacterium sp.]
MNIIEEPVEKVILVGTDTYEALDELQELVETAGAETVAVMVQHIDKPSVSTYLGSGKLEELSILIDGTGATGIICDDELTPAQMSNLERILGTKVMDRTMVILDIFAQHAVTSEGKIQVELAQLQYRLTRLTGKGLSMSRLGGGIGTRGPGEKKLEQDRRVIRNRVAQLKRELNDVVSHRELTRKRRGENAVPVFAIVGYTNVGKSTLLNRLTGADVLAENKLFATLDTTTRSFSFEGGEQILLTDTVGFIRKLPHNLVDAFRSTLEEAKYADYIMHVVDISADDPEEDMKVVYETLDMLGIEGKKILTVFNKVDRAMEKAADSRVSGESAGNSSATGEKTYDSQNTHNIWPDNIELPIRIRDDRAYKKVSISAKTGKGIESLIAAMAEMIKEDRKYLEKTFGYNEMSAVAEIRSNGHVIKEEYREDGIYVEAEVPASIFNKYIRIVPEENV